MSSSVGGGSGEPGLVAGLSARGVIDGLPRAVVVTDPDGRILLWNQAAERLYGWSASEVVGRSILEVLAPPDELVENKERLAAVVSGTAVAGDRTVVSSSGEMLRVSTTTRPVLDDAGEVLAIVGVAEDVTRLRLIEQQSRDLTDHLRLALQAGGLGTWRRSVVTGEMVIDDRLASLHGLQAGGLDKAFDTFILSVHPDDRQQVVAAVIGEVRSDSGYQVEYRVEWPDGSNRWLSGAVAVTVDDDGQVTGTVGCLGDVTDRVNQEIELQRLADLERRQRERLEFVGAINDALNQSNSVREVMENVTNRAVPRLGDWCSMHVLPEPMAAIPEVVIAHVNPEMVIFARQLQERFPFDPGAPTGIPFVLRTGETLFYPDINDDVLVDATDQARDIISQLSLRSAIVVPLMKRGQILGAMQFVLSNTDRRYISDDVALAQAIASRVASSLENHRLNDQQRVIAQTLQRSLLPPSLPDIPTVEIAVRYWAAGEGSEVGGDFYDVFPLEAEHHWAIVIGDVCGTGASAAALTGLARQSIRASAWHGETPVEVLTSLSRAIRRSTTDTFLTAIYAVLDTSQTRPTLTLVCGGHPLPVHVTSQTAQPIGRPGTLLGVVDYPKLQPSTITLNAGDVAVFYTDGATDLPPPHGLNQNQFTDLIARVITPTDSAETNADRIHQALDKIQPFSQREDDLALLVLRVSGSQQSPDAPAGTS